MSFVVLKNVTELFENPEKKGVGIPTVISATGSKFLAVGTSLGNTALFEVGVKGYKLLGSAEHRKQIPSHGTGRRYADRLGSLLLLLTQEGTRHSKQNPQTVFLL
jgi:hypothetical protein